ncbi:hypothetical protein ACIRRH_27795 [Kitasatospora sp. NPDC101235]|uniref:hypothetical protein n=1 Tax=Kitasatospora sp. NPDC101235 TaxID=3364101 RepID=UPI0037FB7A12
MQLRLNTMVKQVRHDCVILSDGEVIKTRLVVWGGGEKAADIAATGSLPTGRGGRVNVQADLTVPGLPQVYAHRLGPERLTTVRSEFGGRAEKKPAGCISQPRCPASTASRSAGLYGNNPSAT